MNITIDSNSPLPAYLQLYRRLASDIASGVYPYGTKLPSKRTVIAETGLSAVTVEHAFSLLADEGYVATRERSGVYAAYREGRTDAVRGAEGDAARCGASGTDAPDGGTVSVPPPYARFRAYGAPSRHHDAGDFPFTVLAKAMRKVLADYGDRILVKSPNHGAPELRSEIASYLARSRGIAVPPARIIIGSGAEYLYGLIAQLLGRDRVYALEKPSYDKIRKVYEALGCRCELLELGADGIVSEALAKTEATVLHVTPFNSFPSGVTVGVSKKNEYLRWAEERSGFLIEDNYDSELTVSRKAEDTLFSMTERADVIYVNTFSKTIAPSVRIGYMLLPETLLGPFNERLGFYSCTVPLFEQYVLAELLRNGDFERHISRERRRRRKALPERTVWDQEPCGTIHESSREGMNRQEFLERLESFGLPKSEYMIRSGGSLLLRGLRKKTADFDLCVSEKLAEQLALADCATDETGSYVPFEGVQMKPTLGKYPFDVIDGYRCETLESILALKRELMRPKDLHDIRTIERLRGETHLYAEEFIRILRAVTENGLRGSELSEAVVRSIDPEQVYASEDRLITDLYFTLMHYAGGEEDVSGEEWTFFLQCLAGLRRYSAANKRNALKTPGTEKTLLSRGKTGIIKNNT